jgi:urease accessory protein
VLQARSWLPRTEGSLRLGFARRGAATVLDALHQAGAARVRFPSPAPGAPPEAVLINTAGGLTGGDRIDVAVTLGEGAEATVTTAAAEKIYRARDGEASVRVKIALVAGAELAWLPQPTILFDRSSLDRRTEIELAGDARLLAVEMLVFGRRAMGEDVHRGACRDAWRVRRDGGLAWADTFRAEGAVAGMLDRAGTFAGARAAAMLLYVGPDAAGRLERVRALLQSAGGNAGASTWNGVLVVRALAPDGHALVRDIAPVAEALSGRPLPRVWQC